MQPPQGQQEPAGGTGHVRQPARAPAEPQLAEAPVQRQPIIMISPNCVCIGTGKRQRCVGFYDCSCHKTM